MVLYYVNLGNARYPRQSSDGLRGMPGPDSLKTYTGSSPSRGRYQSAQKPRYRQGSQGHVLVGLRTHARSRDSASISETQLQHHSPDSLRHRL